MDILILPARNKVYIIELDRVECERKLVSQKGGTSPGDVKEFFGMRFAWRVLLLG